MSHHDQVYVGAGDPNSGPNVRQALDQVRLAPAEPWGAPGGVQPHPTTVEEGLGVCKCGNWAGLSMLLASHLNWCMGAGWPLVSEFMEWGWQKSTRAKAGRRVSSND